MILLYIIVFAAWACCALYCAALSMLADMKNPKLFLKRFWDVTSHMDEAYGKHKKSFTYSFLFAAIMAAPACYSLLKIVEYFR